MGNYGVYHFLLAVAELKSLFDGLIPFDETVHRETDRYVLRFGVVFDKMPDGVEATVNSAAIVILAAEILMSGLLLILGYVKGVLNKLLDAFILRS